MKGGDPDQNRRPSMFAESQDTEKKSCDQIARRMTAADFAIWQERHAARLRECENERQERIVGIVARCVQHWQREGMSFDDAGEWVLRTFNYRVGQITKRDVKRALQQLRWRPASSTPANGSGE